MTSGDGGWLCEQCTCLPEQEGDCLPTLFSDIPQSLPLNGIPTHAKSCANEQQMDGSLICKCGKETLGCSIHPTTRESWIASMQDSLARILALPENRQGLAKKRAVAYTVKSSASLAWFDPVTCSLKTSQQSLLTDLEPSLPILPRSGMTRNGYVYELPTVGRIITETDGGFLPTPTASSAGTNGKTLDKETGKWVNGTPSLYMMASRNMWPTPTAHNAKECAAPSESERNTPTLAAQAGGKLNPTWVCWLMGFPLVWFNGVKK